jgi:hypothetical protein
MHLLEIDGITMPTWNDKVYYFTGGESPAVNPVLRSLLEIGGTPPEKIAIRLPHRLKQGEGEMDTRNRALSHIERRTQATLLSYSKIIFSRREPSPVLSHNYPSFVWRREKKMKSYWLYIESVSIPPGCHQFRPATVHAKNKDSWVSELTSKLTFAARKHKKIK